jgi:hypothetical protein
MAYYLQASYVLDTEDFLFRLRKRRRFSSIGTTPDKADVAKAADAVKAQRLRQMWWENLFSQHFGTNSLWKKTTGAGAGKYQSM